MIHVTMQGDVKLCRKFIMTDLFNEYNADVCCTYDDEATTDNKLNNQCCKYYDPDGDEIDPEEVDSSGHDMCEELIRSLN